MDTESKIEYLKTHNWFCLGGTWHHPFLPAKKLDLESAFLYERFKRQDDEEQLFDDCQGS